MIPLPANLNGFLRKVLALHSLGWAAVLMQPGETFALSRSTDRMAALMSEPAWAVLFAVAGILLAVTFKVGGWPRACITTAVAFGHVWVAVSFAQSSDLLSLGIVTELCFAIEAMWLLGQDLKDRHA